MTLCRVPGCNRRSIANRRGLCWPHWRLPGTRKAYGAPLLHIVGRICEVDFCHRRHKAKGYCSIHYDRVITKGTILSDAELATRIEEARRTRV